MLYASVGHGGGSGYLAAMALVGVAPILMKPTALALNVLVASIAIWKFYRAGYFSWAIFWPFAILSVPLAYVGGTLALPADVYRPLVGVALLVAASLLVFRKKKEREAGSEVVPRGLALAAGAGIGFLSGLTGIGGGVYLSPLLVLSGWADPRVAAGIAALFILLNSIAGLLGHIAIVAAPPAFLPVLAVVAALGGWIGAHIGSRFAGPRQVTRLLALVLLIAGLKMVFA